MTDLKAVLSFLDELVCVESVADIDGVVLPALAVLLQATLVIYHHTAHPTDPIQIDIGWPPELFTPKALLGYSELADAHPLVQHLGTAVSTDPDTPFAVSDLVSSRVWRTSRVYREALRPLGGEDQMVAVLRASPDHIEAVSLTRHNGQFTDRDRELLRRVRPHLRVAITRARQQTVPGWVALQVRPSVRWINPTPRPTSGLGAVLSERELEVLDLIASGLTSEQAARRLGLSRRTVSKHLENIYRKLGVQSRTAAARLGLGGGLRPETS